MAPVLLLILIHRVRSELGKCDRGHGRCWAEQLLREHWVCVAFPQGGAVACVCHPWLVGWYHEAATDQRGGQFPMAPCVQVLLAPLRLATMPWATRLFPLWRREEGWGHCAFRRRAGGRWACGASLGPLPGSGFRFTAAVFWPLVVLLSLLLSKCSAAGAGWASAAAGSSGLLCRPLTLDLPFPGPSGFPAASHGDHWSCSLIALSCRCYRRNHSHIHWGGQGRRC